jgi:hypothetical protein
MGDHRPTRAAMLADIDTLSLTFDAAEAGIAFAQDLTACMPIRRGERVGSLDGLVA